MIYLIDEKTKRQADYGWNAQRFEKYKGIIESISDYYRFEDDKFLDDIFAKGNVVLFHESFFNGIAQNERYIIQKFNQKLEFFAQTDIVVFYGGSKRSRKIDGNYVYLPVSVFYEHLETYLNKGQNEIKYLIWGNNPDVEKDLLTKITYANNTMVDDNYDYSYVSSNILLIISSDRKNQLYIPSTNHNITIKELYPDNKANEPISDKLLHEYVYDWLNEMEYDSIILPLCFGPILSDYNGLRLSMHIRCTATPNQKKPIYIYSVANMSDLINNEYFDVLKTKGVQMINYDNESILSSMEKKTTPIEDNVLKNEMRKVKLNLPQNYIDSHSIANVWAIYRWAKTIGADDDDIEKVIATVETNLYFKYLNTIYPVLPQGQLKEKDLTISPDSLNYKPKVLLVDDEAHLGWYKIFYIIFKDINHFYFRHLDEEFNEKSPDEIVQIIHKKIIDDNIDVVVLDYRLHKFDFSAKRIEDITGFKVLKGIKDKINRGIQVIILSATNKTWNLEALQAAEADGFIMKDNPEGIYSELSTKESIHKFKCTFENCCSKLFLKQFYKNYENLEKDFKPRAYSKMPDLPKDFVNETMKWFKLSCDILKLGINEETKASSFLFLFSVIENIANYIVDIDNPIETTDNDGNSIRHFQFRRKNRYLMSFNKDMIKTKLPLTIKKGQNIPWNQKILNTLDFISVSGINETIKELITKRNAFIHANATTGNKIVITKDDIVSLHNIVFNGLINI